LRREQPRRGACSSPRTKAESSCCRLGTLAETIIPGERISIQDWYCLLRKREMGIELSAGPLVDNDGLHPPRTWSGTIALKPGRYPLRLDWFNFCTSFYLEGSCLFSNQPVLLAGSNSATRWWMILRQTNLAPGLVAECYEGCWESIPDFDLLQPVKVGVVTNFDVGFRTRDEWWAFVSPGYFNAPYDGPYRFSVRSDDGSLLFSQKGRLAPRDSGFHQCFRPPTRPIYGERFGALTDRRWMTLGGHVAFVSRTGKGLEFELGSGPDVVTVRVADAADWIQPPC